MAFADPAAALAYHRDYYQRNREAFKERSRARYAADPEKFKEDINRAHRANPEHYLWKVAKCRAKRTGVEFTITPSDINIPVHCLVTGVLLAGVLEGKRQPNTPSIDRIDYTKGYIPGNVHVICWRINFIKSQATLSELVQLGRWAAKQEKKT